MDSPLHHFELHPILHLTLLGLDISINKAVVAMWAGLALVILFFMVAGRRQAALVPGKLQSVAEIG
ncbi:MAG: F0F1 ATP synthase subunit A, partial [Nitrospinaceae bacterium]|nr:F0F1 ATP synthase subunit A [Nitrospinaceae bacterium]